MDFNKKNKIFMLLLTSSYVNKCIYISHKVYSIRAFCFVSLANIKTYLWV